METETLSSYEKTKNRHIPEENMDIGSPRNDECDLLPAKKVYEDSSGDDTEHAKDQIDCDPLEIKENEVRAQITNNMNEKDSDAESRDEDDDAMSDSETNENEKVLALCDNQDALDEEQTDDEGDIGELSHEDTRSDVSPIGDENSLDKTFDDSDMENNAEETDEKLQQNHENSRSEANEEEIEEARSNAGVADERLRQSADNSESDKEENDDAKNGAQVTDEMLQRSPDNSESDTNEEERDNTSNNVEEPDNSGDEENKEEKDNRSDEENKNIYCSEKYSRSSNNDAEHKNENKPLSPEEIIHDENLPGEDPLCINEKSDENKPSDEIDQNKLANLEETSKGHSLEENKSKNDDSEMDKKQLPNSEEIEGGKVKKSDDHKDKNKLPVPENSEVILTCENMDSERKSPAEHDKHIEKVNTTVIHNDIIENGEDNTDSLSAKETEGEKSEIVAGGPLLVNEAEAGGGNETQNVKCSPNENGQEMIEVANKDKTSSEDSKVNDENDSSGVVPNEKDVENAETVNTENSEEGNDTCDNWSLLKETLSKKREEDKDSKEPDVDEDVEMDEDFDPSLLCPDIAMEVDEAPVITTDDKAPDDGDKSPLLYESVFSTFVDEMTGAEVSFDLTHEEELLRQQTYGEKNPIQYNKVHCTACNVHLGSALDGQGNRFVHPLLKVLICKDCYHFYTSGEFEKDEDGSELYCRWCGQGGQVMCCSNCEMVFCKKCIRINFDRKKLAEIRDSDDWLCFRCNPSQLIYLRVHCAEFMEYVRREISRAATLENATAFMTTDYTQCCLPVRKKQPAEAPPGEPKKKKRRTFVDPDYDPLQARGPPQPSTSGLQVTTSGPDSAKTSPVRISAGTPASNATEPKKSDGVQANQNNMAYKLGNTTVRNMTPNYQPRPRVQVINPAACSSTSNVRPPSSGPGYIKILPGGIRVPGNTPSRAQTYISPSALRPQGTPPRMVRPPHTPQMKHEWFEKTVRAAARVNSNLSYTLTQLNRAQATATSVEALAVVHNKLQEILSTSINSLIQIRKNLRTEFITGIKNIRFPPKVIQATPPPLQPQPSTSAQDDDVIFVSPSTSPIPPPLTPTGVFSGYKLPPSVSLTKRTPVTPNTLSSPIASTSKSGNDPKPQMFLRVKSLTALQNVTSECITIPDDPPPLASVEYDKDVTIIEDSPTKKQDDADVIEIIKDEVKENREKTASVLKKDDKMAASKNEKVNSISKNVSVLLNCHTNGVDDDNSEEDDPETVSSNLKRPSSPDMKRIMNVKVFLQRSEEVDKLVKIAYGHVNGDTSDCSKDE